ncbi:MAG TPA: hypothetical protein VGX48_26610 [Pyrinomonadaceae bacterium]|jgi:hypothetical protein|nr:hypothetical protein [Pyrinomonadaceae bacterium]
MTPNPTQKPTGSVPSVFRYGCGVLALVMALFSLFFVIAAFFDLFVKRDETPAGVLVGMLVVFGGFAVGGVFIAWNMFRRRPVPPNTDLENRILQLAEARGCRLTVPMVALHCRVGIEESRAALERMVTQGAATPEVEDDGGIVYDFSDLLPSTPTRTHTIGD